MSPETSTFKLQTPGKFPEEYKLQSYSVSDSAPTHWRTASIPPLQVYMETDAIERSVTTPSRFTRQNSPPYPLHTKKGWGLQLNYKSHRRKITYLSGSEPIFSVVHPEDYSTLYHYPQPGKCEYAFILNKFAEHSPLWEANGHLLKKFFTLYSTRRFSTIFKIQPYCDPDESSLHHHAFLL